MKAKRLKVGQWVKAKTESLVPKEIIGRILRLKYTYMPEIPMSRTYKNFKKGDYVIGIKSDTWTTVGSLGKVVFVDFANSTMRYCVAWKTGDKAGQQYWVFDHTIRKLNKYELMYYTYLL